MVDYNAQVNQTPYYPISSSGSKKRKIGMTLAGGLIGMNAYYIPVKKDVFVNRAFEIAQKEAEDQINILKNIAEEVANGDVSTESKMILQDLGLSQDVSSIANKCSALDKSVTDPASVKNLKARFRSGFDSYKKNPALMDNTCAKAFKAAKQSKFKWGTGIGAAIGLALSLITSSD